MRGSVEERSVEVIGRRKLMNFNGHLLMFYVSYSSCIVDKWQNNRL